MPRRRPFDSDQDWTDEPGDWLPGAHWEAVEYEEVEGGIILDDGSFLPFAEEDQEPDGSNANDDDEEC